MSTKDRKRVLIVTEAGDAWPSGYARALIYKPLFEADGIDCEYVSRYLPPLIRVLERRVVLGRLVGSSLLPLLGYLNTSLARIREAAIIRRAAKGYDAIYLQKVGSWRMVSALRRACRSRLVYDLNDGVWLPSRADLVDGINDILHNVDAVTCDNTFGLDFAKSFNDSLFLVPDPPQIEVFDQYRASIPKHDSPVVLGWVGSPSTLFNLYAVWEPLEALFERFDNITLRLLGTGSDRSLWPRFEKVRYTTLPFYTQEQMVREVLQMDIGLFPLFDLEDSRVRGILKAAVYMSGEACVIAAPIGQNCELIHDRQNGMLARTSEEWLGKMSELVENVALRRSIARAGLETVRENFTVSQCYERLRDALLGLA